MILIFPLHFLAKILQQLAKQKILSSSKGPHGGFSLLKDPRNITLLDIVNTIDGYDTFTNCVMHKGTCEGVNREKKFCPLHEDYEKTRTELIDLFSNKTIYDLVNEGRQFRIYFYLTVSLSAGLIRSHNSTET